MSLAQGAEIARLSQLASELLARVASVEQRLADAERVVKVLADVRLAPRMEEPRRGR